MQNKHLENNETPEALLQIWCPDKEHSYTGALCGVTNKRPSSNERQIKSQKYCIITTLGCLGSFQGT